MEMKEKSIPKKIIEKSMEVLKSARRRVCLKCLKILDSDKLSCPFCNNKLVSCFPASSEEDRFPFIYPRDQTFICKALDILHQHEATEEAYMFLKQVQAEDGEWVQRYNFYGKSEVSRPKETDCVGLVLHGIHNHYLATNSLDFLELMWSSVKKGVSYVKSMMKDYLVYGQHAIFECPYLENGYEIWTNCWCWRGLSDSAQIAEVLYHHNEADDWRELENKLKEKILEVFWDNENEHFIKTIKKDGERINYADISTVTPLWSELISPTDEKAKKTVQFVVENLWDPDIGGFQRFKKWEYVNDWYWYDGGHGTWIFLTLKMAHVFDLMKEYKLRDDSLRWCLRFLTEEFYLPEHVSKLEEYLEWKQKSRKTPYIERSMRNAEKRVIALSPNLKVILWITPFYWSSAELIKTLLK